MPISYHGIAPTAILIMLICLLIRQVWQHYRKNYPVRRRSSFPLNHKKY